MRRHLKGALGLFVILAIPALTAIILFFPSEWKPAFITLLLLIVFGGFYFGYRSVYRKSLK
jgi:hypothetical protein